MHTDNNLPETQNNNQPALPKVKVAGKQLAPVTSDDSHSPWLASLKEAFGVHDNDLATLLLSQLAGGCFKALPGNESAINGVVAAVAEMKPQDPVEATLSINMMACHVQAMRLMRQVANNDSTLRSEAVNADIKLADRLIRTGAMLVEALSRHRRKGAQKMTVEHVHVHAGAQAIVGNVSQGDQT